MLKIILTLVFLRLYLLDMCDMCAHLWIFSYTFAIQRGMTQIQRCNIWSRLNFFTFLFAYCLVVA